MFIYLAPKGLEQVFEEELAGHVQQRHGRLFVTDSPITSHWAQNVWLEPKTFQFQSISQAAKHLRAIQRNWHLHGVACHRRAQLIKDQLPVIRPKPVAFPSPLPKAPLGSWTLFDEGTLVYSAHCSSPFPDGEVEFEENRVDPPSRAYLKLWEFFLLKQKYPQSGERVLDLGSSPGGWTWVLDQLGAQVVSVDKAPLAEGLKLSSRVEYRSESAFGLKPETVGQVDWLFSDIICYPERLLDLVNTWMGHAKNMVCTIKFQGPTDRSIVDRFLEIPGSTVMHLHHNKHELTWSRLS